LANNQSTKDLIYRMEATTLKHSNGFTARN